MAESDPNPFRTRLEPELFGMKMRVLCQWCDWIGYRVDRPGPRITDKPCPVCGGEVLVG